MADQHDTWEYVYERLHPSHLAGTIVGARCECGERLDWSPEDAVARPTLAMTPEQASNVRGRYAHHAHAEHVAAQVGGEQRNVATEWGNAVVTERPTGKTRPTDGATLYDFTVTFRGETNDFGRAAGRVSDLVVRDIARHVIARQTGQLPALPREMPVTR